MPVGDREGGPPEVNAELTNKSQEALSAASSRAVSAGHADLTPAHLLTALLEQQDADNMANLKDLLIAVGADPAAVHAAVKAQLDALPTVQGATVAPPQASRETLAVLADASQQATELGHAYVSTEHLLMRL